MSDQEAKSDAVTDQDAITDQDAVSDQEVKSDTEIKSNTETVGSVLVVGAGIGGMQSALDLAESGYKVYLLDSAPAIGGTMAALDKTFPTNDCAMCVMSPKLVECGRHLNIEIITLADVESVEGEPGNFKVKLRHHPRYIDVEKCTGCGQCVTDCPVRNIPHFELEPVPEPELAGEDLETITRIIESRGGEAGTLNAILQEINDHYHYLPEDLLRYVSYRLEIPLSKIYNLATFYNAFSLTRRGKHIIQVCLGTACHVKGAPKILEALERELGIRAGGTTDDNLFSLEAVRCLGCCGLAPVITVGDEVYGGLTQAQIPSIIEHYRKAVKSEYAGAKA